MPFGLEYKVSYRAVYYDDDDDDRRVGAGATCDFPSLR